MKRFVPIFVFLWVSQSEACFGQEKKDSLEKLNAERESIAKRLIDIEAQMQKIWSTGGVKLAGVTFAVPTIEQAKKYGLPQKRRGPIIRKIDNPKIFIDGPSPTEGCEVVLVKRPVQPLDVIGVINLDEVDRWLAIIVQLANPPRNGWPARPSSFPKNVVPPMSVPQLGQAIAQQMVSPDEYKKLWEGTRKSMRKRAAETKDAKESDRLLKAAQAPLPREHEGKYICRLVYVKGKIYKTCLVGISKSEHIQLRDTLKLAPLQHGLYWPWYSPYFSWSPY